MCIDPAEAKSYWKWGLNLQELHGPHEGHSVNITSNDEGCKNILKGKLLLLRIQPWKKGLYAFSGLLEDLHEKIKAQSPFWRQRRIPVMW